MLIRLLSKRPLLQVLCNDLRVHLAQFLDLRSISRLTCIDRSWASALRSRVAWKQAEMLCISAVNLDANTAPDTTMSFVANVRFDLDHLPHDMPIDQAISRFACISRRLTCIEKLEIREQERGVSIREMNRITWEIFHWQKFVHLTHLKFNLCLIDLPYPRGFDMVHMPPPLLGRLQSLTLELDVGESATLFADKVRRWETDCILGSAHLVHLEYMSDTLRMREDEPSLEHLTMLRRFYALNWTSRIPVPLEQLTVIGYTDDALQIKKRASSPLMNDVINSCRKLELLDLRDGVVSLERLLADEDVGRLRELRLFKVSIIEWPAALSWARLTSLTFLEITIDSRVSVEALEHVAACRSITLKSLKLLILLPDDENNGRLAQCVALLSRNLERLEIECNDASQLLVLVTGVDPRNTAQLVRVALLCWSMLPTEVKGVLYLVARHFPHLTDLEVEADFQTSIGNSWPQGGGIWPALRDLRLRDTSAPDTTVTGKQKNRYAAFWVRFAREVAPRLRRLRIEGFPSLTTQHALHLLTYGVHLQSLELPDLSVASRDQRYTHIKEYNIWETHPNPHPHTTLRRLIVSPRIASWWVAQVIRNCQQHIELQLS